MSKNTSDLTLVNNVCLSFDEPSISATASVVQGKKFIIVFLDLLRLHTQYIW